MFSAWLWGYCLARTIIWPQRLEGLTWLPPHNPNAWYSLTDIKGRINQKYLGTLCIATNISTLIVYMSIPKNAPLVLATTLHHALVNLWWPAFFELKYSWTLCSVFIAVAVACTIPIVVSNVLYAAVLPVPLWALWITLYATIQVKKPTTVLEYHRRESRTLDV
jgi:hypothetical protein